MPAPDTIDWDAIEKLTDVIEAIQRVHLPFLVPIQQLALSDLRPYAIAAQVELDKRAELEAEQQREKAAKQKAEEEARAKEEEAANQPAKGNGAPVRRELPPLAAPPAR